MSIKLQRPCLENNPPAIKLTDVDLGYRGKPVIRRLNCTISKGESLGIVGPNGSGKTTLLKALLGIFPPMTGSIWTNPDMRFAYVPQTEMLGLQLPLTVREVVFLALQSRRAFGRVSSEETQAAEHAIERVGIARIQDQTIQECSGGQRQKTLLAQALSQKPDVLLLDEPTKGLDVAAEHDLLQLIQNLKTEERLTILLVTHVLHIPLNYMERVLVLSQGVGVLATPDELVHTKRLEEIYGAPFILAESGGVKWATPLRGER